MNMVKQRRPSVQTLLAWYDAEGREFPWRVRPEDRRQGAVIDPYRVWLSEIMLQQTRASTVLSYYQRFMARWPTVEALAAASLDEVLGEWAGLGYYARARNLHACAREIVSQHASRFPRTPRELARLPGIGRYTAAAIAAIAFDAPTVAVDGNVERVMARLGAITAPFPAARKEVRALAEGMAPRRRAGDFTQALMDLGATICLPRAPRCEICPWLARCAAREKGLVHELPRREPRPRPVVRHGVAFIAMGPAGEVLLVRRPPRGLLGGMLALPGSDWTESPPGAVAIRQSAPLAAQWRKLDEEVRHVFTHFTLRLEVRVSEVETCVQPSSGEWLPQEKLGSAALPVVMRKALAIAGIR